MATLETDRLVLRMFREDDLPQLAEYYRHGETTLYVGGTDDWTGVWRRIAGYLGHWQLLGYGMFAVEEKASGDLVGRVGFLNPAGWPGFELGWMLGRPHWGKGFATEAAAACLRFAFEELKRPHVISLIDPDNERSALVAERIGERHEGWAHVKNCPIRIFGISREQWQQRNE